MLYQPVVGRLAGWKKTQESILKLMFGSSKEGERTAQQGELTQIFLLNQTADQPKENQV